MPVITTKEARQKVSAGLKRNLEKRKAASQQVRKLEAMRTVSRPKKPTTVG